MSLVLLMATVLQLLPHPSPVRVEYVLTIDSATARDIGVEMRIHNAPDTLRLAMAAHPEYDDRYWRYLRDLHVQDGGHDVAIVREDSAVWRAVVTGGNAIVRYRITPPSYPHGRGSWQAYLSPEGGLVGGSHTFLYLIGQESAPSRVTLRLPSGWRSATGLSRVSDSVYSATNVGQLLDGPIQIGKFLRLRFKIAGVPHDIVYAAAGTDIQLDTGALVSGLARLAQTSHDVFGRFPYGRFVFLLEEGAYGGGLEHESSVTLGISAAELSRHPATFFGGAAHEYFHVWNEVHLRPRGWGGVSTRPPVHTREMWWMEGVTMFYSDVLARRAHLPVERATRSAQLAHEIGDYLNNPSNARVSPEDASWWSGDAPDRHELRPDLYLQGRLLGAMLDLVVRDSTDGRRSLDDVMRRLYVNDGGRGYTGGDIQRAAEETCGCALSRFFESQVRHAGAIDFDGYLGAAGLRTEVRVAPATDSAGRMLPDARVWAYAAAGDTAPRLLISQPDGVWAHAGLRTGDVVQRWNGAMVTGVGDVRSKMRALQLGDTVTLDYARGAAAGRATVQIEGYVEHVVRLVSVGRATKRQLSVRRGAMLGG